MRGRRPFFFFYSILVALAVASEAGAWDGTTVCICDDGAEWPPYSYYQRVDGKPTEAIVGFSVDIIDRIFKSHGISYQISLLPWKRCMHQVAEGNNYHMFLSGGRNPERDRTYYVSKAYYWMHPSYLFSTQQHPDGLAISGRKDLKNYRICGILGYNYIVFGLTPKDIDTGTSDYDTLTKKLLTGRCDLSVDRLEILLGFKAIGKNFISHPDLAYQVIPGEPTESFHMMFSKNEFGRHLKQIVDDGLRELQASGELESLIRKYDLFISAASEHNYLDR